MGWLYVPASAGWNSESDSPSPDTELWVTSSGKPSLRPRSWRGWKTRPWIALLSGTTLPASEAESGVASWILSLRDFPASPSLSLDDEPEPLTPATSGP